MTAEMKTKISAAHTVYMRAYRAEHPDKDIAAHHAYYVKNREEIHAKNMVYRKQHPEGSAAIRKRYRFTRRTLGFVPLNRYFIGSDGHHIDFERVIHIPHGLHESVRHNVFTGKNMAQINAIAYNFLFKQEVEGALEARRG